MHTFVRGTTQEWPAPGMAHQLSYTPMFNLMLEAFSALDRSTTVAPGFRRGWNVGDRQVVVGAAVPLPHVGGTTTAALLTYFSYELPFTGL